LPRVLRVIGAEVDTDAGHRHCVIHTRVVESVIALVNKSRPHEYRLASEIPNETRTLRARA
jgi:hypothetical protein